VENYSFTLCGLQLSERVFMIARLSQYFIIAQGALIGANDYRVWKLVGDGPCFRFRQAADI
jgi:hypothetical protein